MPVNEVVLDSSISDFDFEALLDASLAENKMERGDIVSGTILSVDPHGLMVDVGWKQDGIVPRQDIERMDAQLSDYDSGATIDVAVLFLEDRNGNLVLSVSQARQNEDWNKAEVLLESEENSVGEVMAANKGGLIIPFGHLRGFIPASHVTDLPRGISDDDRLTYLQNMVGTEIAFKVIEVNRKRRRLVFSQRHAERESRNARKDELLGNLEEGHVVDGVVSGLCDFGAFVDLGGADGLIHISELAWHRVRNPSEVVNIGDEVTVHILHLDREGKRIGLSLKRLQDNPWAVVEDRYHIGQLVEGVVSRVEDFGAFVSLDPGIEALLHISQMATDQTVHPRRIVYEGETILSRIISIEAEKQRLGLSLIEVTKEEKEQWLEQREEALELAAEEAEDDLEEGDEETVIDEAVDEVEEAVGESEADTV